MLNENNTQTNKTGCIHFLGMRITVLCLFFRFPLTSIFHTLAEKKKLRELLKFVFNYFECANILIFSYIYELYKSYMKYKVYLVSLIC